MNAENMEAKSIAIQLQYDYGLFDDMTLEEEWAKPLLEKLEYRGEFRNPTIDNVRFYELTDEDKNVSGRFNPDNMTIYLRDFSNIADVLHEMIHCYEEQLDKLSPALRELVLIHVWDNIKDKIADLESRITKFLEIIDHDELEGQGGRHGLLFLLKSYDLDLRLDLPLGTVFGYGGHAS